MRYLLCEDSSRERKAAQRVLNEDVAESIEISLGRHTQIGVVIHISRT